LDQRAVKDRNERKKYAELPLGQSARSYDLPVKIPLETTSISCRELKRIEQNYNLILMGPSGNKEKTYLAAGLCFDAVAITGYRAPTSKLWNPW